jgi:hypothetical protein
MDETKRKAFANRILWGIDHSANKRIAFKDPKMIEFCDELVKEKVLEVSVINNKRWFSRPTQQK